MKRRLLVFLACVLSGLMLMPITNLLVSGSPPDGKWWKKAFLFNVDILSSKLSSVTTPLGISLEPEQVTLGHDGWMYLGDQYEKTLTVDRLPPSDTDKATSQLIARQMTAWNAYLALRGVALFRVMVGPNKGTIYPEFMPRWAMPAKPNATDAFVAAMDPGLFLDLRPVLLARKQTARSDLYYKTDTHWNLLGAGMAFQQFMKEIAMAAPGLRSPDDAVYQVIRVNPRGGGDLARFLRIGSAVKDLEPELRIQVRYPSSTRYDYATGQLIGDTSTQLDAPHVPVLVKNPLALNNKKVLWLRDSFGTAMSPFMGHTFSDVVQLHWVEAIKDGGQFAQIVNEWKPDYVFITLVERSLRNDVFALSPPSN